MLFACLGSVPAYAGAYVSSSLGVCLPEDAHFPTGDFPLDSALVLNGAAGYTFGSARFEGAISYQQNGYTNHESEWGDLKILTVMANGYYELDTGSDIKPYLMAGAGIADVSTSDDYTSGTVFAWQVGAGIGIKATKKITCDLGYRYLAANNVSSFEGDMDWRTHEIIAGIRYDF